MNVPLTSLEPRVNAGALPLELLSRNEHVSDRDKTKEVARQFEAVLLRQILQSAHKTGLEGIGGDDEDSASKEIYFDMMNYHLADTLSRGGGLGLASALEAQLTRQTSPAPEGDGKPAA
jgi:Rod binding domain-containing protein